MCEVCAVFGIGGHWTDAGTIADTRLPAPDIARYRVERRRRVELLNALVGPAGLRVRDWDGEAYWVEDRSGRGMQAADLSAVWRAAAQLAGHALDPLADDFASR